MGQTDTEWGETKTDKGKLRQGGRDTDRVGTEWGRQSEGERERNITLEKMIERERRIQAD